MSVFPNDVDGAVLADLAARGIDLKQPLTIEFPIAAPDESSAKNIAAAIAQEGYKPRIEYDEGEPDFDPEIDDPDEYGPSWTIYISVRIVPEYIELKRIQARLDQIANPSGGKYDGWGVVLG
ncbi:MAG: ribonuclease E inhibitor RraB [Planctomycetota bacterium]